MYELDENIKPIRHYYVADEEQVKAAMAKVAAQGKAKWGRTIAHRQWQILFIYWFQLQSSFPRLWLAHVCFSMYDQMLIGEHRLKTYLKNLDMQYKYVHFSFVPNVFFLNLLSNLNYIDFLCMHGISLSSQKWMLKICNYGYLWRLYHKGREHGYTELFSIFV